ncbi:hypothetical protein CHS0354_033973 [Potamilus streckersoni]|uniref:Uncharacterized protein n=1 Tax=Potamilus streckersoni TaxID=2493646 RepID=A0AAE0T8T6_9BIVA|nr:hypothetical protein CHS0354_033973 [Potamilus streckersoni]
MYFGHLYIIILVVMPLHERNMSSNTVTVTPKLKRAMLPPAAKEEEKLSKETVLIRNPLPKYSFQEQTKQRNTKREDSSINTDRKSKTDQTQQRDVSVIRSESFHEGERVSVISNLTESTPARVRSDSDFLREKPVNKVDPLKSRRVDDERSFISLSKPNSISPVTSTSTSILVQPGQKPPSQVPSKYNPVEMSHLENSIPQLIDRSDELFTGQFSLPNRASVNLVVNNSGPPCTSAEAVFTSVVSSLSQPLQVSMATVAQDNSEQIKSLEAEIKSLKAQLGVQLQVNSELKKLLVASLGEDLQNRVERLARVMVDELASGKAFYAMQFQESQNSLEQLLNERHELRANLLETNRCLQQVKGAFDPLNSENSRASSLLSTNVLDLAHSNQHLAEAIKYRLLPGHVTVPVSALKESDWQDQLTKAEAFARDILSKRVRPEDFKHFASSHLQAPSSLTVDRFHPFTRFDNLTVNVCCKCKGDIIVV